MQFQFFKHHKLILKLHVEGKNGKDTSEEQMEDISFQIIKTI